MLVAFIYDIDINLFQGVDADVLSELRTEFFSATEANAIVAAIKAASHEVVIIDGAKKFLEHIGDLAAKVDFIFNEAKGVHGPDRKVLVPALCQALSIAYLGSGAYAMSLTRNKWHTQAVAEAAGIQCPECRFCASTDDAKDWTYFPSIVKPNNESASIGIDERSYVTTSAQLVDRVEYVINTYKQPALVQRFIDGREVQVALLGTDMVEVLGMTEVVNSASTFIRRGDWRQNNVGFIPFEATHATKSSLAQMALKLYSTLALSDYGRLDFILSRGRAYFIEAATHPHIVPGSSFTLAAAQSGLTFHEMIKVLLESSYRRQC